MFECWQSCPCGAGTVYLVTLSILPGVPLPHHPLSLALSPLLQYKQQSIFLLHFTLRSLPSYPVIFALNLDLYFSEWAIVRAGLGSLLLITTEEGIKLVTHCSQLSACTTALWIIRLVMVTSFFFVERPWLKRHSAPQILQPSPHSPFRLTFLSHLSNPPSPQPSML